MAWALAQCLEMVSVPVAPAAGLVEWAPRRAWARARALLSVLRRALVPPAAVRVLVHAA